MTPKVAVPAPLAAGPPLPRAGGAGLRASRKRREAACALERRVIRRGGSRCGLSGRSPPVYEPLGVQVGEALQEEVGDVADLRLGEVPVQDVHGVAHGALTRGSRHGERRHIGKSRRIHRPPTHSSMTIHRLQSLLQVPVRILHHLFPGKWRKRRRNTP